MRIVTMADGTQHEVFRCGAADGVLWVGLTGMAFLDAVTAFSDADKTKVIISGYDTAEGLQTRFEGFTAILLARADTEGTTIALRKDDADATD
jgi:hypothetical protein